MSMKRAWKGVLGLCAALGFLACNAEAQFKNGSQPTELNIPRVSQRGSVTQRIGLTDITISYHRPAVGGREIWGKIVPYSKVWRSGANENTTITFADDVTVEGKPLAAGTYGLHTIPDKDQWTIIFSKNSTSWGSFSWSDVGMVGSEAEVAALPLSAFGVVAVPQDPPVAADHHLALLESRSSRHLWSPIRVGKPANNTTNRADRWSRMLATGHIMDHDPSFYKDK